MSEAAAIMIIPGRYRQPFSICCRIQSNPDDPKTLLAMLRSCNRSAGENNRQIALCVHFKLGGFSDGCIIAKRCLLGNGIIPDFWILLHTVFQIQKTAAALATHRRRRISRFSRAALSMAASMT